MNQPIGRRRLLYAAAATVAATALVGCDRLAPTKPKAGFNGIDITGAEYARNLSLPDQNGRARTLADFHGKVVVVFFGYTQCPDVCPGTMAELAQLRKSFGKDGDRIQGVFITVDPDRDTPELLRSYLSSFDPSFIALRGTSDQTAVVAKEFKVFFAKVPGKVDGSYTVDHTAGSYVFDAAGKVRLFVRYGTGAEALASDLRSLLAA